MRAGGASERYDASMHGIRVGPLVAAAIAVVLLFEARLFFTQGSPLFGGLALVIASVCVWYALRPYVRGTAMRRQALGRATRRPTREREEHPGHPERG